MAKTENFKRVIIAIIAIPLILIASFLGGIYFFLFVVAISLLSFYEFSLLVKNKGADINLFLSSILILVLLLNSYYHFTNLEAIILLGSLSLLIIELFRNKGSAINNLGSVFLGIFYIGIFATSLINLREYYSTSLEVSVNGAILIISILASIWIGDSAAYYGGITFGRHKLFPRVSPKKSWEGAIFGFIFSVGTMILARVLVLDFLNWKNILIIGVIIGVIGQIGDLVESLIKRDSQVKDSSSLIPGHGGFFDRFDSLLFSAPAIWIYLKYFA